MPRLSTCEDVRSALVELEPAAKTTLPGFLLAHLEICASCRTLVSALDAAPDRGTALYGESLRNRTLAAVRAATEREQPGLGWLLLLPAAAGAVIGTLAPPWLLASIMQAMSATPTLAWTCAAAAMLATSAAAASVVAMLVNRPLASRLGAAASVRLGEV